MNYEVLSVNYGLWYVKCVGRELWTLKHELWSVNYYCEVWTMKYELLSVNVTAGLLLND